MFGKKQHGDLRKSYQKVLDGKKDTLTRLKHLRILLDTYDLNDSKRFFETNHCTCYYIFYDAFIHLEYELKRGNKSHREELDGVLFIFEKILVLLPELIHKRWQFHSIGRILVKLLHQDNVLKLRREGMRLFLIWYQILQENATKLCHQMFSSLVPVISRQASTDHILDEDGEMNTGDVKIGPVEISAILPPGTGESLPDNVTKCLLDSLVLFMVSEITNVEWENKQMQEFSFNFLFNYFKQHYLMKIFPEFSYERSIYDGDFALPSKDLGPEDVLGKNEELGDYQEVIIKWLTLYTHSSKKQEHNSSGTDDLPREQTDGDAIQPGEQDNGNDVSALPVPSTPNNDAGSGGRAPLDDKTTPGYDIVKSSLLSTRENINLVHELFRQAFHFSFKHTSAMRKVIAVYRDWLQSEERPVFMQDPQLQSQDEMKIEEEEQIPVGGSVRVGSQLIMQAFITHSANVFLHESSAAYVNDQVDMCKRVLNIYRHVVMNLPMERQTWERLLMVLLKITSSVLKDSPPVDRDGSLGGRLASALFQTLIVTWIKANLNVFIPAELWDRFLMVLSSLTQWEELIKEWAKTIETLTRLLARNVYNLDVNDLPLDRLSEQKEKRRRAKTSAGTLNSHRSRSNTTHAFNGDAQSTRSARSSGGEGQSSHALLRDDRGRKSEGALETFPKENTVERMRSLSGSPGDHPSSSNSTFHRSSSDSHLYNSATAAGRVETSVTELKTSTQLIDPLADPLVDPLAGELTDVLGDHPLTGDQDIRSLTDSLTSAGDSASYASVESNLQFPSQLDTTLVDQLHRENSRDDNYTALGLDTDSSEINDRTLQQSSFELCSRDILYPLRAEFLQREKSVESRSCSPSRESSGRSSPSQSLIVDEGLDLICEKDSSTPDRESIHIDAVVYAQDNLHDSANLLVSGEECQSVLAGGTMPGWTPDVCVVLWRRMLCALGDVNDITNPDIHASVYEYLCELMETLIKIRDNVAVTMDNVSSPKTPELLPPLMIFASWLFKALSLSDDFKRGKLLAFRLLCLITLRRHDVFISSDHVMTDFIIPPDHVAQFYSAVHDGLTSNDQDVANTLLRHCGPFFSIGPAGNTLLCMDMMEAANKALSSNELQFTPRTEALSILGALVCFPCLDHSLVVLESGSTQSVPISSLEFKDRLITSLLKCGKKEPVGLARCVALCSLGIYLYHELKQNSMHSKVLEAISTLTMTLRFTNKLVAQVACDVLYLLTDHVHIILEKMPQVPVRVIQSISATISGGLPMAEAGTDSSTERLMCSLMFCLLEWTMRVPNQLLLDIESSQKPLIYTVFKVLNQVVGGCSLNSISRSTLTLNKLVQGEVDLENIKETQSCPTSPWSVQDVPCVADLSDDVDAVNKNQCGQAVKTAARTVLNHLVNHFGHFPRGGGAARFNSSVQEFHDVPEFLMDDLRPEIFDLPNVQFFVLNSSALISLVELPAWRDVPGGGLTAGLSTGNTITRLVIRDCTGKYCWDGAVLHRPYDNDENAPSELEEYGLVSLENEDEFSVSDRIADSFSFLRETQQDELNKLLNYIGTTSKECLLNSGGPLNIPGPPADWIPEEAERDMCQCVLEQKEDEQEYSQQSRNDDRMVAREETSLVIENPVSQFYLCRTLLSQLGYLSWEKRATFDLLKKSERLLRELKNIDNRYCRETHKFAVFYVAVGQEDKNSILTNSAGSKAYEDFVSGLGWEVDLETHCGYRGGLPNDKSCGDTTPYYATSTLEIIFHCSSRMLGTTEEDRHRKLRHLGNDEVMIVWSEHRRDYRRGIVPTEFGDVLIVIYPLDNGLFRIQIDKKTEVPFFGPLFDGAIVEETVLSGLVRATALHAGRAKRATMPYYRPFYEERARYLSTIVSEHKQDSTFEEFAGDVFSPVIDPGNECNEYLDGSDNTDSDGTSYRFEQRDAEQLLVFPSQSSEKVGRRLSFRNVRRLSSRSSGVTDAQQQAPPNGFSSPESPDRNNTTTEISSSQ